MPDSAIRQGKGKRERLIASAGELIHQHGAERTTLAEIATAADVPPGNVYYYFKTRDDLIAAVIASHSAHVRDLLAAAEQHPTPRQRLKVMVHDWAELRQLVAAHGCPIGTLVTELNKHADGLDRAAAELFTLIIDWAERQFQALHRHDARELAITLLAGLQGASLLANTFHDPELMTREVDRLERWIDTIKRDRLT